MGCIILYGSIEWSWWFVVSVVDFGWDLGDGSWKLGVGYLVGVFG